MGWYTWGGSITSSIADLITNLKLNEQGVALFTGLAGYENQLQLGWYASDGALIFLPNSVPVTPNKTLEFKDNSGNLLTYIRSDGQTQIGATVGGALTVQPTAQASAGQPLFVVNTSGGSTQFGVTATGGIFSNSPASLGNLAGAINVTGSLNVSNTAVFQNVVIAGTASINLQATSGNALGTLTVSGEASIGSMLVTSAATVGGAFSAGSDIFTGGNLHVTNGTAAVASAVQADTLQAGSQVPPAHGLGVQGGISVGGAASLASTLAVAGGMYQATGMASMNQVISTQGIITPVAASLGWVVFGPNTPTASGALGYTAGPQLTLGDGGTARPIGMTQLQIATSTGSVQTLTFNNYPLAYRHLLIEVIGRSSGAIAEGINLRFNQDSGNNYSYAQGTIGASGATGIAASTTSQIVGPLVPGTNDSTATDCTMAQIFLPFYSQTSFGKQANIIGGQAVAAGFSFGASGGIWNSTVAATIVTLTLIGNWVLGSQAILYGLGG